jgi:GT2 family glycosyltransferase
MTSDAARRPSTSIVMLTCDGLEVTRRCIESIREHTPEPHELVLVDNGSTDGTLEYLRSLAGATVIENGRNLGFGAGCNLGMAASTGERILLLNNDVVVTDGWLAGMHDALDSDADAALAGPRTNRITGEQQVDDVGYGVETLAGLDAWAAGWTSEHAGRRGRIRRLVGFCILLEREVVDRIGGFDLRYGIGNFEDDDLCLRAGVAGFSCTVAHDSFIHHVGSSTFTGQGIDYAERMGESYRAFAAAWRLSPEDIDPVTGSYPADRLVESTTFDPARHVAPLVASLDVAERIELPGRRTHVLGVCCDRLDVDATRRALEAALGAYGPDDDVTVAVRIDPRDATSHELLDEVADHVGDASLPDVALVEASDEDDRPLLLAVDELLVVDGRMARGRRLLAAHVGVPVVSPDELAARLA